MYGMNMSNDKLWMTDGKTLKTVWYDMPHQGSGLPARAISTPRTASGAAGSTADDMAMFDPKTHKIKEWKAPTPWTRPYDAEFDDKTYVWSAGMDNDFALRLQ